MIVLNCSVAVNCGEEVGGVWDTVTCVYVLNVVSSNTGALILYHVQHLLKPGGRAYFAVRRDVPRDGTQTQEYVELDEPREIGECSFSLPLIRETCTYAIYEMTKD
jgi:hypothetical protein